MSKTCPPSTGSDRYGLAVIGAGSAGFSQRTASTTEVAKLVRRHLDTEQELLTSVTQSTDASHLILCWREGNWVPTFSSWPLHRTSLDE